MLLILLLVKVLVVIVVVAMAIAYTCIGGTTIQPDFYYCINGTKKLKLTRKRRMIEGKK